jgi:hypothetical protein
VIEYIAVHAQLFKLRLKRTDKFDGEIRLCNAMLISFDLLHQRIFCHHSPGKHGKYK